MSTMVHHLGVDTYTRRAAAMHNVMRRVRHKSEGDNTGTGTNTIGRLQARGFGLRPVKHRATRDLFRVASTGMIVAVLN